VVLATRRVIILVRVACIDVPVGGHQGIAVLKEGISGVEHPHEIGVDRSLVHVQNELLFAACELPGDLFLQGHDVRPWLCSQGHPSMSTAWYVFRRVTWALDKSRADRGQC